MARYSINRTKFLTESETVHLEKVLNENQVSDERNFLLLSVAMRTGARAQEILNLRSIDLDDSAQSLFVRGLKGSSDREIPLPRALYRKLKAYVEKNGTERIFPISYSRLRDIWHMYRPAPKKFHSLRHTFAVHIYKKTKDVKLVQLVLGHRNITNTMVYVDHVYSAEQMRRLLEI